MKKSERLQSLLPPAADSLGPKSCPPHFNLYLDLFNRQAYYQAHDILEILWLEDRGFLPLKGLIQLAGAFVHLQKHFLNPGHPKHSGRLRPAGALLRLAQRNLLVPNIPDLPLPGLATGAASLCTDWIQKLEASFNNPWSPHNAPQFPPSLPCLTPSTTTS
jgi:hypothetical protein